MEPINIIDDLSDDSDAESDAKSDEDDEIPQLRIYQQAAVDAVLQAIGEGTRRIGVSAPTGAGKTIIFAFVIREVLKKHRKGKVLVLVGTEEQARQAKDKSLMRTVARGYLLERNVIRSEPLLVTKCRSGSHL